MKFLLFFIFFTTLFIIGQIAVQGKEQLINPPADCANDFQCINVRCPCYKYCYTYLTVEEGKVSVRQGRCISVSVG
jgi:hypothetical protein